MNQRQSAVTTADFFNDIGSTADIGPLVVRPLCLLDALCGTFTDAQRLAIKGRHRPHGVDKMRKSTLVALGLALGMTVSGYALAQSSSQSGSGSSPSGGSMKSDTDQNKRSTTGAGSGSNNTKPGASGFAPGRNPGTANETNPGRSNNPPPGQQMQDQPSRGSGSGSTNR